MTIPLDNALQVFDLKNNPVRVVMDEQGEPWFVAKDVAEILGYSNPHDAVRRFCKGVSETRTPSAGGMQTVKIIPERDLYRLIMRSKLPSAERFEEWVVGEVLPAIRKHGGYLTPSKIEEALLDPDVIIRLATDLKEERAKRIEAERTKAQISSNREATVMGRLSGAVRENRKLKDQLGEGETWKQARF